MAEASGERSALYLTPLGPAGGGMGPVVSGTGIVAGGTRTVASSQWSVASECEESELAIIEKRQNEADLPMALVIGILRLRTNEGRTVSERGGD